MADVGRPACVELGRLSCCSTTQPRPAAAGRSCRSLLRCTGTMPAAGPRPAAAGLGWRPSGLALAARRQLPLAGAGAAGDSHAMQSRCWTYCNQHANVITTSFHSSVNFYPLTRSLPSQFFPGCHPRVGLSFAEVPAGYLLYGWVTWRVYSSVAAANAH